MAREFVTEDGAPVEMQSFTAQAACDRGFLPADWDQNRGA